MGYYSSTKILNEVYSGETLNIQNYASGTNVLNAVYDDDVSALRVKVEGYIDPSYDISYDDDLYYSKDNDILYTPNLVITSGEESSLKLKDISTGVLYNIYIEDGVLKIS